MLTLFFLNFMLKLLLEILKINWSIHFNKLNHSFQLTVALNTQSKKQIS
jgi:hypothetical protein